MATTKQAAVPSLIKAVRIAQYGGSEQLKYEEAPLPEIGPGQVLAKVHYAGVNPIDWKIREGSMKQFRPASFPLTLGTGFRGRDRDRVAATTGRFQNGRAGVRVRRRDLCGVHDGGDYISSRRFRRKSILRWPRRCRRRG